LLWQSLYSFDDVGAERGHEPQYGSRLEESFHQGPRGDRNDKIQRESAFYAVTTAIQHTQSVLEATGMDKLPETREGDVSITAIDDPVFLNVLRDRARELQSSLLTLGTRQTSKVAHRLLESLERDGLSYPALVSFSKDIRERLQDELEDVTLLVLSVDDRDLFEPREPLFGPEFEAKFPTQGAFELDEAAKCRALGRPTAAVFHLMRVMEIGLLPLPLFGHSRSLEASRSQLGTYSQVDP
jgi:hypothetical protein